MSVVNQMLRDLDARGLRGASSSAGLQAVATARTLVRRPRGAAAALLACGTLAGSALGWAGWPAIGVAGAKAAEAPVVARAMAVAAPVATPVAPPVVPPAPPPAEAPVEMSAATPNPLVPAATANTPPAVRPLRAPAAIRPARVALATPSTTTSVPRAALAASAPAAAPTPLKQFALVDRMQAARELWGAGQGEAAMALLREALAAPAGDTARGAAVRELARMELMSRDAAAALQTLDRHAGELRGDAQAWALRGNAAQRLGRHDDAVTAFEAAVRLQSDDSRSMLGAAVSLAAAGDVAQARQWVERARRAGSVPEDVAAYLRRLGVTLER